MKESKHQQAFARNHLKSGESIVAWGEGYIGEMMGKGNKTQRNGVLLVTDERIAFYRKGFFGEVLETIPLKSITSIERRSVLGHRTIRVHTSHDDLEFKTFDKSAESNLTKAIEAGRNAGLSATSALPDHLEMLRKLADLKNADILSEEEFQSKKAELLAKI